MRSHLSRGEAERLVQTYSDLILRLSVTYLKNTEDAKDICQTVFLRLLEKPREFQSPEHERAWIIRTAVNVCKDQLKSSWRRQRWTCQRPRTPGRRRRRRGACGQQWRCSRQNTGR